MTETTGASPGTASSGPHTTQAAVAPAYRRPGLALAIAAIGFALAVAVLLVYPALPVALAAGPPRANRLVDLVVLSAPLVLAVAVAGWLAADGIARATGIRSWQLIDPVLGVLVALVLRAIVELAAPTRATLRGPLETEGTPDAAGGALVLVVGLILVSPVVEELFFRGLLLRALEDSLAGVGRVIAVLAALLISTAAFVVLHIVTWQGGAPLGLLVGTVSVGVGCGILTIATRRLGAAVVTHVTYNAIGVALLLF